MLSSLILFLSIRNPRLGRCAFLLATMRIIVWFIVAGGVGIFFPFMRSIPLPFTRMRTCSRRMAAVMVFVIPLKELPHLPRQSLITMDAFSVFLNLRKHICQHLLQKGACHPCLMLVPVCAFFYIK